MTRQDVLRNSLIAALVLGTLAGSVSSSFAATTGGRGNSGGSGAANGGGGSGPSGGNGGNGGSGAGATGGVSAASLVRCPPTIAGCYNQPRRPTLRIIPTRTVEQTRCSNAWRLVELEDGSIVEDRSEPMRKTCRVIRTFD